MDVKKVFFYDFIDQLIYMELPKSIVTEANKNMVYKLLKTLYSFKQFSRFWYNRVFVFFLEHLSLMQTHIDSNILTTNADLNGPILSTFIFNIKIIDLKGSGFI